MPYRLLRNIAIYIVIQCCITSCYYHSTKTAPDGSPYTSEFVDTLGFSSSHHYAVGYNFIVKTDTMNILVQLPEEELNNLHTDSVNVVKDDPLVVADIRIIPTDSLDSVWVKVARDQYTMGWVRESRLLNNVRPNDPISTFIDVFSNIHLIIFLVVVGVIAVAYIMRRLLKRGAYIVHFNDIPSVYPTVLVLLVSATASLYASIQMFAPQMWRHFYYHPTLNPFEVPSILSLFLISIWSMLIISLAVISEVRKSLRTDDAFMYLAGLLAVCAIDYLVFSFFTLYYIGYIFLALYAIYAIYRYYNFAYSRYLCGNCGAKMREKGRCPKCGRENS